MKMLASSVAAEVGGRLSGEDVTVDGAAVDSRSVAGGELFVPLVAARDGHDFIAPALRAGASAYLTGRPAQGGTAIEVADPAAAMRVLARYCRRRLACTGADVVGVTGSVGKTTTKDLLAAVLAAERRTHASQKSFNNWIGTPLTLLNTPEGTQCLVLELGANAPGEIDDLCQLAEPQVGVVTRVAPAHTLGFGSIEGVARAKAELVQALPATGTAVLNADDPRVLAMGGQTNATVVTFGSAPAADVCFRALGLSDDLRAHVAMSTPWGELETTLAVRGAHQASNAAAAVAAAGCLGLDVAKMASALAQAEASGMRMELLRAPNGLTVLDDSYNASPAALEAALAALARLPARRHLAVLGHMAELGDLSAQEHRRVALLARELNIEVLAVAAPEYGVEDVPSPEAAVERLADLGPQDAVLVKGSREAGMEVVARRLARMT